VEPWYRAVETALVPAMKMWFNWRFEGLEHVPGEGPALVACNHTSYFDPPAHGHFIHRAGRRPRFLAKSELYDNWFLRQVLRGARQIPVYRGTGSHAPVDAAMEALAQGEVVVIYPEATVTRSPDHMPMKAKTGVARLTLATGVPVVPLAVWGAHNVWQKDGRLGMAFGRPIWLKAGPPLDFSEHVATPNDPAVLRAVTDAIMAELSRLVADLRSRYPKRWS
jgi:1-acyl-sn-glycerol-3-phosphate acyltransferase